jgi:hypothetical protein
MNKKFPFLIGAQRGGHKRQPKRLAELERAVHKGSAAGRYGMKILRRLVFENLDGVLRNDSANTPGTANDWTTPLRSIRNGNFLFMAQPPSFAGGESEAPVQFIHTFTDPAYRHPQYIRKS